MKRKIAAATTAVALVVGAMMWASPAMADDEVLPEEAVTSVEAVTPDVEEVAVEAVTPAPETVVEVVATEEKSSFQEPPAEAVVAEPQAQPEFICDESGEGWQAKVDWDGDGNPTVTAPEGFLIDAYCVKAGTEKFIIEVDPPAASVEIDHPEKDSVSHYQIHLVPVEEEEPVEVAPTLAWTPPTCDDDGTLTLGEGRWMWSAVLNEDGSTTYTATATEGAIIPEGTQFQWTVPNLSRLPEDSDECYEDEEPTPVSLGIPSYDDVCGTEDDGGGLPEPVEGIDYGWVSDDPESPDYWTVYAEVWEGYIVNEVPDGWVKVGEGQYEYPFTMTDESCDEPTPPAPPAPPAQPAPPAPASTGSLAVTGGGDVAPILPIGAAATVMLGIALTLMRRFAQR